MSGGSHVVLHSVKMGLGSNGGLRDIEGHKVGFYLFITTILEVPNDGCPCGHPNRPPNERLKFAPHNRRED